MYSGGILPHLPDIRKCLFFGGEKGRICTHLEDSGMSQGPSKKLQGWYLYIYIDISQVSSCKFPFKKLWWGHFLALKNQGSPQEKVVSSPFMTTFYYMFIYFPGPLGITAGISITFTLSPTWRVEQTRKACRFQRHRSRGTCGLWLPLRGFWGVEMAGDGQVDGEMGRLVDGSEIYTTNWRMFASHSGKISITISTKGRSSKTQLSFKNL